jgi:hypothetical protein
MSAKPLSHGAQVVRQALMDGLVKVTDFAAGVGKSERTVYRWIADGMPTVYVGSTPYIPVAEARAWLVKSRRPAHARDAKADFVKHSRGTRR